MYVWTTLRIIWPVGLIFMIKLKVKMCVRLTWQDSNLGPLMSEANTLPIGKHNQQFKANADKSKFYILKWDVVKLQSTLPSRRRWLIDKKFCFNFLHQLSPYVLAFPKCNSIALGPILVLSSMVKLMKLFINLIIWLTFSLKNYFIKQKSLSRITFT